MTETKLFEKEQEINAMGLTKMLLGLDSGLYYYSRLNKDEEDIDIVLAMSIYITSTLIMEQLPEHLAALKRFKILEVLDVDLELMTNVKFWMKNYKLKSDMESMNDQTLHERGFEISYKGFKPETTWELYQAIERNILDIVEMLTEVQQILNDAPAGLYENFYLSEKAAVDAKPVKARFRKWKRDVGVATPELLKDKEMQELVYLLTQKVMRHVVDISYRESGQVDLEALKQYMVNGFEFPKEFPICYARFRRFVKEGDTLQLNYDSYGQYLHEAYYKLTPDEHQALIEFDIMLDLIHQEMAKQVQTDALNSVENRIRQSIAQLMEERYNDKPLFNKRSHWQAVYRILVDKKYCTDSNFDGFDVFIKRVMPDKVNKPYMKESVKQISQTDFWKPFNEWKLDSTTSKTSKPFERMAVIALRFKEILEENGL